MGRCAVAKAADDGIIDDDKEEDCAAEAAAAGNGIEADEAKADEAEAVNVVKADAETAGAAAAVSLTEQLLSSSCRKAHKSNPLLPRAHLLLTSFKREASTVNEGRHSGIGCQHSAIARNRACGQSEGASNRLPARTCCTTSMSESWL